MTAEAAKRAFLAKVPVTHGGITYPEISALIYRRDGDKTGLQLELMDKASNSVTIAAPAKVEPSAPIPLPEDAGDDGTLYRVESVKLCRRGEAFTVYADGRKEYDGSNPFAAGVIFSQNAGEAVHRRFRQEYLDVGKDRLSGQ